MSYYTHFTIIIQDVAGTDQKAKFEQLLRDAELANSTDYREVYRPEYLERLDRAAKTISTLDKGTIELVRMGEIDVGKWYTCEADMIAFSKALPDFVFEVCGEGEEAEDLWRKWFYQGICYGGKAEIIYPKRPKL